MWQSQFLMPCQYLKLKACTEKGPEIEDVRRIARIKVDSESGFSAQIICESDSTKFEPKIVYSQLHSRIQENSELKRIN